MSGPAESAFVGIDRLERAREIAAAAILRCGGAAFLIPIFERIEAELAARAAQSSAVERAAVMATAGPIAVRRRGRSRVA